MDFRGLIAELESTGVRFEDPLSDDEVAAVQARFGFVFPADLRAFLQTALPVSGRFPDWRSGEEETLRAQLRRPLEGIEFDVRHDIWWQCWGPKPESVANRLAVVRRWVADATKLIPVNSHRYMPERPSMAGNPALSVHQTDVMLYGSDLADYLRNDFLRQRGERIRTRPDVRPVDGWQAFL